MMSDVPNHVSSALNKQGIRVEVRRKSCSKQLVNDRIGIPGKFEKCKGQQAHTTLEPGNLDDAHLASQAPTEIQQLNAGT